jgi:putative SOS response-associated peptidase YedK
MCNLYSITTNQAAIAALFRVMNQYVGNLPPMPGVFPDYPAPVVRNAGQNADGARELIMMRWGMPPPPRGVSIPVTNIRNTSSPHWRGWLKPEHRCLVPANSFAEYAPEPNPETKKRTWCGSRAMKIGRCSRSPESGPNSKAIAAPSRSRFPGRIWSTVF